VVKNSPSKKKRKKRGPGGQHLTKLMNEKGKEKKGEREKKKKKKKGKETRKGETKRATFFGKNKVSGGEKKEIRSFRGILRFLRGEELPSLQQRNKRGPHARQ